MTPEELIERVSNPNFRKQMRGYSIAEVNAYLDEVTEQILRGEPVHPPADGFQMAGLRHGYSRRDVDELITEVVSATGG